MWGTSNQYFGRVMKPPYSLVPYANVTKRIGMDNDYDYYRTRLLMDWDGNFRECILPNNTLWGVSTVTNTTLSIVTTSLTRFSSDNGYGNPKISSSTPGINATVPNALTNITLRFITSVVLSTGNISIYQTGINGEDLLRQTIYGLSELASTTDNASSVLFKFWSTFNQPGASYYVLMDNNFVKTKQLDEPIRGIEKNEYWLYSDNYADSYSDGTTCLLRLTREEISNELSRITPIEANRLSTSKRWQNDAKTQQVLMEFKLIHQYHYQILETYGFMPATNLWEKYKYQLIYVCGGIVLVCTAFLIACFLYPEYSHPLPLSDIQWNLSIPKQRETAQNHEFSKWLNTNTHMTTIVAIVSDADIDALRIIGSQFVGLKIFSAPFSMYK
ncbi:10696_t:CDS:2 [Ambispora leptoticha]|uniref:10696_t:CDS:1 n=1 Tax=Ambispora leptoticha TaxID=144679 RepID=A0A9N9AAM2_9GLOM|nr:10696_t:CDS:2 [Ambispora leptoticha]